MRLFPGSKSGRARKGREARSEGKVSKRGTDCRKLPGRDIVFFSFIQPGRIRAKGCLSLLLPAPEAPIRSLERKGCPPQQTATCPSRPPDSRDYALLTSTIADRSFPQWRETLFRRHQNMAPCRHRDKKMSGRITSAGHPDKLGRVYSIYYNLTFLSTWHQPSRLKTAESCGCTNGSRRLLRVNQPYTRVHFTRIYKTLSPGHRPRAFVSKKMFLRCQCSISFLERWTRCTSMAGLLTRFPRCAFPAQRPVAKGYCICG